ncbi:MAG: 50S ribosomal protein L6 [Candidatus Pacearchaeota archaeon]|nr:MAG: 50S ribosomal protein L6 [Candidatus Pacearchaeota archaeon]
MKKEHYKRIEIPNEVQVEIDGNKVKVKGKEGEIERDFKKNKIELKKENNTIIIGHKKATKKEKRIINSIASHIKNMISGVQKKFEYKLKVVYSHFPISVEFKNENREFIVKNFLGEVKPRKTILPEGVEIEIEKDVIVVKSPNKELAGQVAAKIETLTKIKARDRRVFQDGIFIINKAGREI